MFSNDDVSNFHGFIMQTPEGALRKMLVNGDLTDAHFRLLVKLAKGADEANFVECFQNDGFGQLRLSVKEMPLREHFWAVCKKKVLSLGIIGESKAAA